MIKLVGFQFQSGTIVSKDTGEVIPWSNVLLRCLSDEGLLDNEFGYSVAEKKIKGSLIKMSLGLDSAAKDEEVISILGKFLDQNIEFTIGFVKGVPEINGFKVVDK